jgi:CMP-N-acetylneuraminic acid synthetase
VVEVPHQFNPVSVMRDDHGRLVPFLDGPAPLRRQDKPPVFARNGPAVLAVRASVVAAGSLYGQDCRPLLMAARDSLDIDTPEDFDLLDYYLTRRP